MMQNDSLGKYFYIYAIATIALGILGFNLMEREINYLLPIFIIQLVFQGLITYEGIKHDRYDHYRLFMGFVVPLIVAIFLAWLNTL